MQEFVAFYDILGFKELTKNKTPEIIRRDIGNIFRESQNAISKGNLIQNPRNQIELNPDLSFAEVNCMHVSDSIVFWTTGGTTEANFRNIAEVCFTFNWRCLQSTLPIRGCLVAGEISFEPFRIANKGGIEFYNSSLFGVAITSAYEKAENQDWGGSYIDKSAFNAINGMGTVEREGIINELINQHKIVYYEVPLKNGLYSYELAFRTMGPLNNAAFYNCSKGVEELFRLPMKEGEPFNDSVKRKLNNTIKFLDYFRNEPLPEKKEPQK